MVVRMRNTPAATRAMLAIVKMVGVIYFGSVSAFLAGPYAEKRSPMVPAYVMVYPTSLAIWWEGAVSQLRG